MSKGVMDGLESLVVCLLGLGMAILILAQLAMAFPAARRHLSLTERLEGISYSSSYPYSTAAADAQPRHQSRLGVPEFSTVSIELVGVKSLDGARILVNGESVADFNYPVATVEVRQGDLLEIACPRLSMPVDFRVRSVSPGVSSPAEGDVYEASKRVALGYVGLSKLVRR